MTKAIAMYAALLHPKPDNPVPNQYSGPMAQHHATHRHASTPNVQLRTVATFPAFFFSLISGILPSLPECDRIGQLSRRKRSAIQGV